MANGHGGRRPGAGRKKTATKTYQETMRAQFERVVTPADWQECIAAQLRAAKRGDTVAFKALESWTVGKVPDQVQHDVGGTVRIEWVEE